MESGFSVSLSVDRFARVLRIGLLPGTIANDFRLKTSSKGTGGRDETRLDIKHDWEKLLLAPQKGWLR